MTESFEKRLAASLTDMLIDEGFLLDEIRETDIEIALDLNDLRLTPKHWMESEGQEWEGTLPNPHHKPEPFSELDSDL